MAAAPLLMVGQTVLGSMGQLAGGKAAKKQGKIEQMEAYRQAREHEENAKDEEAAANRQAYEVRRQGKAMEGDAVAAMVAQGGSADDAGAMDTLAGLHQVNEYNALEAIYQGDVRAVGHRKAKSAAIQSGNAAKERGDQAYKDAKWGAVTNLVSGALKLGGPKSDGGLGWFDKKPVTTPPISN